MNLLYDTITYIFDPLHHLWEHEKMHRKISFALVLFFLAGIISIELNRRHILIAPLGSIVPTNHFFAVQASFYAVFRNSGFALSTLIIRIALAAPPFYNVLLGIAAATFAILLTPTSQSLFLKKN